MIEPGPGFLRRMGVDRLELAQRLRLRWSWFAIYGAVCLAFGLAAVAMTAVSTLAVVYVVAVLLILVGGVEITVGFNARGGRAVWLWAISGLFYLVFGAFALAQPVVAAKVLTAAVGMGFLIAGAARIALGLNLPAGPKSFVTLAGAMTLLLGAVILAGWPGNKMIVLGMLFGVDMIFYGASWIALALKLRG